MKATAHNASKTAYGSAEIVTFDNEVSKPSQGGGTRVKDKRNPDSLNVKQRGDQTKEMGRGP